jgi:acyl-CoA reductase-like NAD-dependent aldehyde dehydrogenase
MALNYEENYEECVRILREGFESGINASIDSRKEHLKKLKSLLIENEDAICEALKDDLGKVYFF